MTQRITSSLFALWCAFQPMQAAVPANVDELWAGFEELDRNTPLEIEILKEWEQDGIVCRWLRFQVGVFKGKPSRVAAFYLFPGKVTKLPALLQIHGGGQSANFDGAFADAQRGYASLSLNWGGNRPDFGRARVTHDGPQTDWGALDATHPPQHNPVNHFAGTLTPDEFTLDSEKSPRNSNWFLVLMAARRGLTFLAQQPEVDPARLGVYGHSMGGKLTTNLAGIDPRVKAAVPSCGGAGVVSADLTDVPGCVKTRPDPMDLACISDNAYLPRIQCPILWLSPTNDFHAPPGNMAWNWRVLPDARTRFSISPHLNHRHTDEHAITRQLWFEEHLKGAFQMPESPAMELSLKTADGIPTLRVTPDGSMPVRKVDVYYSTDPHELTRFWRDAQAVKAGTAWQAACPVRGMDEPLLAFANIVYELPQTYRNLARHAGTENTESFAISSRIVTASPQRLRESGVKATGRRSRMIDDGSRGWHDWYQLNWGHPPLWMATTRKPCDPMWRGPDGATLVFDVRCVADNQLVIRVNTNAWGAFVPGKPAVDYAVVKELKGSPDWQTVRVSLGELDPLDGKTAGRLADWRTVTELSLSPSGEVIRGGKKLRVDAKPWQGAREIRLLRWEGGEYPEEH